MTLQILAVLLALVLLSGAAAAAAAAAAANADLPAHAGARGLLATVKATDCLSINVDSMHCAAGTPACCIGFSASDTCITSDKPFVPNAVAGYKCPGGSQLGCC